MTRRAVMSVLGAMLLCLLVSCSTAQPGSSDQTSGSAGAGSPGPTRQQDSSGVDVDTPELRALKQEAHVMPCKRADAPTPRSRPLPSVTLPCLGGGPAVRLSGLRGPLVINLFAQWCGPCRAELPYYQQLHEAGRGRVAVLGIDYLDTQPASALQLAKRAGVTYPLLADPDGRLRAELGVRFLPGVVMVSADGRVRSVQYRAMDDYDELRTLVRSQLGVALAS